MSKFEYEIDIVRLIRELRFIRHFVKLNLKNLDTETQTKLVQEAKFKVINLKRNDYRRKSVLLSSINNLQHNDSSDEENVDKDLNDAVEHL